MERTAVARLRPVLLKDSRGSEQYHSMIKRQSDTWNIDIVEELKPEVDGAGYQMPRFQVQ